MPCSLVHLWVQSYKLRHGRWRFRFHHTSDGCHSHRHHHNHSLQIGFHPPPLHHLHHLVAKPLSFAWQGSSALARLSMSKGDFVGEQMAFQTPRPLRHRRAISSFSCLRERTMMCHSTISQSPFVPWGPFGTPFFPAALSAASCIARRTASRPVPSSSVTVFALMAALYRSHRSLWGSSHRFPGKALAPQGPAGCAPGALLLANIAYYGGGDYCVRIIHTSPSQVTKPFVGTTPAAGNSTINKQREPRRSVFPVLLARKPH